MEIEDKDDDEEDSTEEKQLRSDSFMYFIRTGQFEATIESKTNTIDISPAGKQVKAKKQQLYNGDHFGEIGLIFNSKRTASVKSLNYGSLAKLTKPGYKVLLSNFASLERCFKEYIFKYKDDLRAFLEMEAEKIDYFRPLQMITKQELLFNMERKTYNEGDKIFRINDEIDRLIIIQSGIVELSIPYDKRAPEEQVDRDEMKTRQFVVERLTTGAVINHQAFVVKDIADTEYSCRTPVACFELSYLKFKKIMKRRGDLKNAQKEIFNKLMYPNYKPQIALDYIFHNGMEDSKEYEKQLKHNEYKVRFKNAIMQVWTQVKKESKPKSMKLLISEMIQQQKLKKEKLGTGKKDSSKDDKTEEE